MDPRPLPPPSTHLGGRLVVLLAALLALGALLAAPSASDAATLRDVRLEAGPHSGIRFSSSGAVVARKNVTLSSRTMVRSDRRRVVPNRSGTWLRVTTGTLAGWEVRESFLAYIPGKVGDTAYVPVATVKLAAGRYLGYQFESDGSLRATTYGALSAARTAKASRRAVMDGRSYVLVTSGTWAGTWLPVTAPRGLTAQRLTCETPTKPSAGSSVVLRRVTTTERKVALTFDLGGRMTPALDIMERLVVDRVCATIFPTGDALATATGQAVVGLVNAHPELFELGNHTQNHCNLRDGGGPLDCPKTPPSTTRIQAELRDAAAAIASLGGPAPAPYWRPPYGAYDTRVRTAATAIGYTKTVMWSIDTIDWKPIGDGGPTTSAIANKVVTNAATGSVVLMHLGGYHTYDALPSMVARLRAAGFQPTTVTDLLR